MTYIYSLPSGWCLQFLARGKITLHLQTLRIVKLLLQSDVSLARQGAGLFNEDDTTC